MAIDLENWIPKYVKQVLDYTSGQAIKAARWNELWNLSIEQGDYNSETLDLLIDLVNTKSDDEEIKEILATKADQAWVVSQLALKTDLSVFDAFRNQQNSTNQIVQTALNNRYTKAETDERLNLKFDKTDAQPLLKEVTFDSQTGVFTITRQNGTTFQINTLLEKVPVQFLLEDNKLILIAEDGTRQEADLSAFIDVYTFQDSATVQFVQTMSTNHTVTASVKDKSIGFEQLKDDVYQTISDDRVAAEAAAESALASKTAAENAAAQATTKASEASQSAATALESKNTAVASAESASVSEQSAERDALMAQSYAVGGTGIRPGEDTDNAKYYAQQAGEIAGGDFATKGDLQKHEQYAEETYAKKDEVPQGVIKADGTTVTSAMIPFAQGAKNTSGALGEAQFRNVYFGDAELVEGESELPEGTLYITPEVDGSGESSLPSGGTPGQILTKTEDGAEWANVLAGMKEVYSDENFSVMSDDNIVMVFLISSLQFKFSGDFTRLQDSLNWYFTQSKDVPANIPDEYKPVQNINSVHYYNPSSLSCLNYTLNQSSFIVNYTASIPQETQPTAIQITQNVFPQLIACYKKK